MLFCNRAVVRGVACFFLLETLTTLVAPSVSLAMMGPGQPEFTSYESGASPDLVNLTTGDFTYNIPVLDVPGPERGFSLPLTYRAGIKLEQEASWVGLGWSLNAGAIARSLTGYPDDADGELMKSTYNQKITRGWNGGVPGVLELAWDVNTGHSGSASLIGLAGLGWSGGGISSGSLVGVHADKDGVTANVVEMVASAVTIATLGATSSLSALAVSAASQLGSDVGINTAASVLLGKASGTSSGFNQPTVNTDKGFLHTNYWVFYNDQKSEFMYGSLHFDEMSRRTKYQREADNPSPYIYDHSSNYRTGKSPEFDTQSFSTSAGNFQSSPGADLYQPHGKQGDYWADNSEPISVAHDDFSVMGGSVSGSIRPYRLEVGSLAFPYQGLGEHHRFAAVPYLNDYKVPFRYDNSLSNSYTYHQFTPSAATTTNVVGIEGYQQPYNSAWTGGLILRDPTLIGSGLRTEDARKGVVNHSTGAEQNNQRRLVQGKDIRWYTNEEILQQYQTSTNGNGSLLEVNHPVSREVDVLGEITGYTSCPDPNDPYCQPQPEYAASKALQNNPWRVTLPGKGVGAFAITAEDGTTYHYSLPVYHYTQFSKSYQRQKPNGVESAGVSTQTIGPRNWDALGGGYATTWLLTAITSSDYVDRGALGTVDDADWGGWVRFDYGKFASAYKWRQPYLGESYAPESYNDASFSEGYKETYYLNTIHTRSHTALFLKSVRNDARAHYQAEGFLGIAEDRPSSALRLDEIVLLNNEDWKKLQTVNGIRSASETGSDIPALFTTTPTGSTQVNPKGNGTGFDAAELRPGDTYQYVLDQHDVDADSRIRAFLYRQAIKRVVFNYSYRLCASTPNSFASATAAPSWDETQFACNRTGKLTLESLSSYGPASTKLAPDFKFTYGYNPDYQKNNWDGFGMYKSGVSVNTDPSAANKTKPLDSHQVSTDFATATRDASAWSLTGITSPLGGKTTIAYERDQYGKVSEFNLGTPTISNSDCSNVFTATGLPAGTTLSDFVKAGDVLTGNLSFTYYIPCQSYGDDGYGYPTWYENNSYCSSPDRGPQPVHVTAVSGNTLTIAPQDVWQSTCDDPGDGRSCGGVQPFSASLIIPSFPANRNGGDLRVASISTQDEAGNAYQVRYRYNLDKGTASSGVISKEPAYVVHEERPFDKWFDYPGTSVMYGKVSVLRGLFRNSDATDYSQAEEYTFQTPVSGFVRPEPKTSNYQVISSGDRGTLYSHGWRAVDGYRNATTVNLGMIGQPLAIRKLNRRGEVESSTSFEYSNTLPNSDNQAKQGYFTEGVLTNELLGADKYFYRINRSTKTYVPTVLIATTTKTNGISTRSQQEKFDFFTGNVTESSFRNYLGDLYRSKVIPAYTLPIYAAMGPSSEQSAHRNMLTQEAASYVYKVRPTGGQSVVTASVQTWSSNWATYRGYDATADAYVDQADDPRSIWRLSESYLWNSPSLNADGTYADASFKDFDWSRTPLARQAAGWLKAGEFTRYDHYSKPLESKDINGQYVSRKLGYGHTQRLVTAANARYTEVAYSGAEDVLDQGNGILHFGGEVRDGGRRTSLQHHTGFYSTQLKAGETGFTYKAKLGSEVRGGQKYRLSCWVHQSDANRQGQLYAQVDGQDLGVASIASSNTKQAGEWYLLNLLVDVPSTGRQLTVGCRHAGGSEALPVYVDDFRFHPMTAPTTAYVYDTPTGQLSYVLDNDNLFTHYEYDAAGKAKRISKEILTTAGSGQRAERVVKEYDYNFALMADPNWLPTGTTTWVQGAGGPTNQRQHEERDINPRSTTYNRLRNVADGTYPNCTTCSGPDKEWRNGVCVTRTKVCLGVNPDDCDHTRNRCPYTNVYVYQYSDGTQSAQFEEVSAQPCR
jgi:hypothetical protein